jgi:predicted DNA-binding transcriptional regulator AlpA
LDKKVVTLPETGYLRIKEVLKFIPVGRTSWWLAVKEGRYPQPVKLGPRTTAWRVEDIRELMERLNNAAQPKK